MKLDKLDLLPFAAKPTCPKCGEKNNSTRYCKRPFPSQPCWDHLDSRHNEVEHLCKTCRNCHYSWFTELWDGIEIEEETDGYES